MPPLGLGGIFLVKKGFTLTRHAASIREDHDETSKALNAAVEWVDAFNNLRFLHWKHSTSRSLETCYVMLEVPPVVFNIIQTCHRQTQRG